MKTMKLLPVRYKHQLAMKLRNGVYTEEEVFEVILWLVSRVKGYR
jgi:hypothetical protein